ncbi:hypothetical protein [Acrocarpospora sp. B8E8]|uniref:hypothetical protein n=1 Tax=Acrocarpospora sp. B8E8 TaxID=3153572 RepID=UPI00325D4AAC
MILAHRWLRPITRGTRRWRRTSRHLFPSGCGRAACASAAHLAAHLDVEFTRTSSAGCWAIPPGRLGALDKLVALAIAVAVQTAERPCRFSAPRPSLRPDQLLEWTRMIAPASARAGTTGRAHSANRRRESTNQTWREDGKGPQSGAAYTADLEAGKASNQALIDGILANETPDDKSDDFDAILHRGSPQPRVTPSSNSATTH